MFSYFQFEISLVGIEPRIWRRFLLATTASFEDLHWAIQQSFGWQNDHLWEFRSVAPQPRRLVGVSDDEGWYENQTEPCDMPLSAYFQGPEAATRCRYVYDFGDDWCHEVELQAVVTDEQEFHRRLLAGERMAPPEDCGGIGGYEQCLQAFSAFPRIEDLYADDDEEDPWADDGSEPPPQQPPDEPKIAAGGPTTPASDDDWFNEEEDALEELKDLREWLGEWQPELSDWPNFKSAFDN